MLQASQIQGIVQGALADLGEGRWNQVAQSLRSYELFDRFVKNNKETIDSGDEIERTLLVDFGTGARMTGLFDPDQITAQDHAKRIVVDWAHTVDSWSYDVHEKQMNSGVARIFDHVAQREEATLARIVELMEAQAYGKPTGPTDSLNVKGLTYWVVQNATEGFNGGAPSGHTTVGGLVPGDYPTAWQNYTFTHSAWTKAGLIVPMRLAYKKTKFKKPVPSREYGSGVSDRYGIYVNIDTETEMENIGEAQNENLGRDLASMDGKMTFRGVPIIEVPTLGATSITNYPIYMIDHKYMNALTLKGSWNRITGPSSEHTGSHSVFAVFYDFSWNIICTDRRVQAVGYRA